MDGSIGRWTRPTRQGPWWQRRVEAKRGALLMMMVAAVAFGAMLALAGGGVRAAPAAPLALTSAGEG